MITYLQHTHPNLPHYLDKEWDWLRGALGQASVDAVSIHHAASFKTCVGVDCGCNMSL